MTNASGTKDKPSAGDPIPPKCSVIEVHVGELKQLFNAIDPSPFRDKDLDPKAEEFIVGWAKELPREKCSKNSLPNRSFWAIREPAEASGGNLRYSHAEQ